MTITYRALIRGLTVVAVISVVLAVLAFRDAYRTMPPEGDHILTIAILIAVTLVSATVGITFHITRRDH